VSFVDAEVARRSLWIVRTAGADCTRAFALLDQVERRLRGERDLKRDREAGAVAEVRGGLVTGVRIDPPQGLSGRQGFGEPTGLACLALFALRAFPSLRSGRKLAGLEIGGRQE
jgi:hypothetical protein